MAEFKINNQYARQIQQGESITNNAHLVEGDLLAADLRGLLVEIAGLIERGELHPHTGAEICDALEDATRSTDQRGMVKALRRAGDIAAGITVLGGVAESINKIIGLVTGGS
jgi:hypothetical protein